MLTLWLAAKGVVPNAPEVREGRGIESGNGSPGTEICNDGLQLWSPCDEGIEGGG